MPGIDNYEWLGRILEDTKDSESPTRFKVWATLWTIGAATRRNVIKKMRSVYDCYPNMYIMLIAESGMGKDFPIFMASQLMKRAKITRVMAGRNSIEGVIKRMGKVLTLDNGTIIKNAELALISGEMANLFVNNPDALTILTQLYDTHSMDEWDYTLKHEEIRLKNIYLSLLTATNMEHYNDKIEDKDVKGGYIARTMCIHEKGPDHLDSLMGEDAPEINWDNHALRLQQIATLKGQMHMTKEAETLYDEWYNAYYKKPPRDKTGFVNRQRVHVIKVAMCLALMDRDDMIITKENVIDSMELCMRVQKDLLAETWKQGKHKFRSAYAIITGELMQADDYTMDKSMILRNNLSEFSWRDLDDAIQTLVKAGAVVYVEDGSEPDKIKLRLSEKAIDEWEKKKGGVKL